MRYKNNVLDRLMTLGTAVNRIDVLVNRGGTQEQVNEGIEKIKEAIEGIREIISVEPDDFEQQFAPRQ
jgi:butyrate kinase